MKRLMARSTFIAVSKRCKLTGLMNKKYNNTKSSIAPTRLLERSLIFSLLVAAEVFKDKNRTMSDNFLWEHVATLRLQKNKSKNMVTCPYEAVIMDYTAINNENNKGMAEEISQEELEELINTSKNATQNVVIPLDDIDEVVVINDEDQIDESVP